MRFMNRRDAGMLLGQRLIEVPLHEPLVVALSDGGTVVAAEVARLLDAPLHRFLVVGQAHDVHDTGADTDQRTTAAAIEALVRGRAVILVDEGINTGNTMHTAIGHIATRQPAALVVAAPVATLSMAMELQARCGGGAVFLQTPDRVASIGDWYLEFDEIGPEELHHLLAGRSPVGPLVRPRAELQASTG